MPAETNVTLLIVTAVCGAASGMCVAVVPVLLALIAGYMKLQEIKAETKSISDETKEQTVKIDEAMVVRKEIAAEQKTNQQPQPVVVTNIEPVPVEIKEDGD